MRRVPLLDVAADRGLVGGPFGSSLVNADYVTHGIPVIRGVNMRMGRYVGGEFVYVSREKFTRDLARNVAVPGDIVYTQRGTLGQVCLVPDGIDKYVISQSQMRLRVDEEVADAQYIYYASTTPAFNKQVHDRAISTGVPHTNLRILSELDVPLPPLPEQQAIAEVLGSLDDKIAANTKLAATADAYAAAFLQSSLETAHATLSELAIITMGTSPKGDALNESGEGVPFFQGVRDFGFRSPTSRVFTTSPVRMADAGDILVSVRAPVGEVNRVGQAVCIGRGVASVRSIDGHPATLFYLLRSERAAWEPYEAEGTVFGSINRGQLHGVMLRVPERTKAAELESELSAVESAIDSYLAENRTLAATRDALLPQLMSGKLRVRDAEAVASGALG